MTSALKKPYFHDEAAAFDTLEAIMWPKGYPEHCPVCGVADRMNRLAVQTSKPSKRNPQGKPVYGVWKCYACRGKFTVRKGTIFEESRLELHLWFQAAHLMCSSKKGVSANQLHRTLGVTLKTAWFLAHRLREAMAEGALDPFGIGGGAVESDETFMTRRRRKGEGNRHEQYKTKVLTLIDRQTGRAKSTFLPALRRKTIMRIVRANVQFPGRLEAQEKFTAVRQQGSIDGVLNFVGGKDDTVHLRLEDHAGQQISGCYTTRALGKELGKRLFESVRLFGRGRWNRDDDGVWTLEDFRVENFEALDDAPLTDALAALRAIPTEWDDKAASELSTIRHGSGGKRNGGH